MSLSRLGLNGCERVRLPGRSFGYARRSLNWAVSCDHIVFVLVGADACKCEIFIYSRTADKGYFRDEY